MGPRAKFGRNPPHRALQPRSCAPKGASSTRSCHSVDMRHRFNAAGLALKGSCSIFRRCRQVVDIESTLSRHRADIESTVSRHLVDSSRRCKVAGCALVERSSRQMHRCDPKISLKRVRWASIVAKRGLLARIWTIIVLLGMMWRDEDRGCCPKPSRDYKCVSLGFGLS